MFYRIEAIGESCHVAGFPVSARICRTGSGPRARGSATKRQHNEAAAQRKTPEAGLRGFNGAGCPASEFSGFGKAPAASEPVFALGLFARQFACAPNGFGLLARFLHGRFLEMLLELHFTKHPFALKFLLQSPKRLFDVVVANADLHVVVTTFLG